MKRAFDDEVIGDKLKYDELLLDHLKLQKELVSKKRKLYNEKQKRDTLLSEVRFLRERRNYLLEIRSLEVKDDTNQAYDADVQSRILTESKRNCNVDDAPSCIPNLSVEEPEGEGRDQIGCKLSRTKVKSKKSFAKCTKLGEKNISWPNKMSLETIQEEQGEEQEQKEQIGHELPQMEKLSNCWTDGRVGQFRCL